MKISFLYLALKDLKMIIRDKKALAILILMPLILTSILGFALDGVFTSCEGGIGVKRIPIGIVTVTGGTESSAALSKLIPDSARKEIEAAAKDVDIQDILINKFLQDDEIKKLVSYELLPESEALDKLEKKQLSALVYLPDNLSVDFVSGKNITLKVVTNNSGDIEKSVLKGIIQGFTDALSIPRIGMRVLAEERVAAGIGTTEYSSLPDELRNLINESSNSIELKQVTLEGRKFISAMEYYAAAMSVMFILFAAGFGVNSIIEEKQYLTLNRIILSGAAKWEIVLGKATAVFFIGLLQMTIMIVFSSIVFKVQWGSSPAALLMLTLSAVFAVAGFSVLLAAIVKTNRGADIFQSIVVQFMALLGGSMMPIYSMPDFMKTVAGLTINGQALMGYLRLMEGGTINDVGHSIAYLLIFGAFSLLAGSLTLKLEE